MSYMKIPPPCRSLLLGCCTSIDSSKFGANVTRLPLQAPPSQYDRLLLPIICRAGGAAIGMLPLSAHVGTITPQC